MKSRFLRDAALIIALLAAAAAVYAARPLSSDGRIAEITLDGELFAELSLSEDAVVDIGGRCTLTVENGSARITDAVCRDRICVRHRPISKAGESIVCLPGRVAVKISGGADFVI